MRNVGPGPLVTFLVVMLLLTGLFVMTIGGAYVVDEYVSPSWNEASVPAPTVG